MANQSDLRSIRWLTYMMFFMFAMTSDSVGEIIKEVKIEFGVNNTQASLMHTLFMVGIAFSGLFLGFLADKLGRRKTIILGLAGFAVSCYLFLIGTTFTFILGLITLSGLSVGVFKTGALALIGDISQSTKEHCGTMNGAEAFFGVGAIIGPIIVAYLIRNGAPWIWLYVLAGTLCVLLIFLAWRVDYPEYKVSEADSDKVGMSESFKLLKNPYALGFSIAAFLYVAAESAIYVWMPSYLLCGETDLFACYQTELTKTIAIYSVSIFFAFRALGRFVGIWMMQHFNWSLVMTLFSFAIAVCFLLGIIGGKQVALYTFPLTGIFMSVLYPTINSKGISCFVKAEHGKVAGVILFFTALGAAAGPLAMGIVIDANQGDITTGFMVALIFTVLLFIGSLLNLILSPTEQRLREIEAKQYKVSHEQQ